VQERFPEAQQHYREELKLSTDASNSGYAALQCANAMWPLGQYEEADQMLTRAEQSGAKSADLPVLVSVTRSAMLLSRRLFREALAISRKALAGHPPAREYARFTLITGQSRILLGSVAEGRRDCAVAVSAAEKAGDVTVLREVLLGAAKGLLDSGDPAGARRLLLQAAPGLAGLHYSRWWALALHARAEPENAAGYAVEAQKELNELARQWGDEAYRQFMRRPDVQGLSEALGRIAASHR